MFNKSLKELKNAENNKQPLLYCYIIPRSYFKYKKLSDEFNFFLRHDIMIEKDKFLYKRFNRSFDIIKTTAIVDTHIIICNTNYINNFVKYNVNIFNSLLNEWIIKIENIKFDK
jgi:hypothetical protein